MKREQAATGMGDLGASAGCLASAQRCMVMHLAGPLGAAESKVGAEAERAQLPGGTTAPERAHPP